MKLRRPCSSSIGDLSMGKILDLQVLVATMNMSVAWWLCGIDLNQDPEELESTFSKSPRLNSGAPFVHDTDCATPANNFPRQSNGTSNGQFGSQAADGQGS